MAWTGYTDQAMCFHRTRIRSLACLALLSLSGACKKSAPHPPVDPDGPLTREVRVDAALFFTYVESNGVFATTDEVAKVPEPTRRLVRVMGKVKDGIRWRNNTNVDVIDLRELLAHGKTWTRVMPLEAFETMALAQLPPGDACPLAGPHGPPLVEDPGQLPPSDEPPVAVLYGTDWCGACMAARRYLRSNRIPFSLKDVARDSAGMRELQEKAARLGAQVDRVPVLDVRGRLLVGFDERRMDGFLADW